MIKLKLYQIVNAESVLTKLSNEESLDFTLAYKISRIVKKIQPELQDYYENRKKLLEKFGTTEDGNTYQISDENKENFTNLFNKLLNLDIELTNVYKLKLDELASVKLTVAEINSFEAFLEVEEELDLVRKPFVLEELGE